MSIPFWSSIATDSKTQSRKPKGRLPELKNSVTRVGAYIRHLYALRHLYAIRKWQTTFGGVPNLYRDKATGSGRLSGTGRIHMQRLPKTARRILLNGSGYWDFDFVGCHWFITQSLCRCYQIASPVMDAYLADKTDTELMLAERLGLPARNDKSPKVKKLLLGILMQQRLSTSPFVALRKDIGVEAVRLAQKDDFIKSLTEELRTIRPNIVKRHTHDGIVTNQVGKRKATWYRDWESGELKRTPPRKLFSHVLQGYEAWALNALLTDETDTLVLMFDGWISESQKDTQQMEVRLREISSVQLGFPLSLQIKGEKL